MAVRKALHGGSNVYVCRVIKARCCMPQWRVMGRIRKITPASQRVQARQRSSVKRQKNKHKGRYVAERMLAAVVQRYA